MTSCSGQVYNPLSSSSFSHSSLSTYKANAHMQLGCLGTAFSPILNSFNSNTFPSSSAHSSHAVGSATHSYCSTSTCSAVSPYTSIRILAVSVRINLLATLHLP